MITAHHPEWPAFKAKLEAEIETMRTALEEPIPELDTAMLRGRIKGVRAVIGMVEPKGIDAPAANYSNNR